MNTRDIKVGFPFFGLFKGDPGSGKSLAAHSFPKTYTLAFDRKMGSIKNFYPDQDFEFDEFDSLIDVNHKLDGFKYKCPYQTIIIDSITSYSSLAMRCMMEHRRGKDSKTVRAGIMTAEIEDYNGESAAMTQMLDDLKTISVKQNVNVLMTAHVIEVEHRGPGGRTTNITRSLVTAGKKVAAYIPTQFDECYHFDVQPTMDANAGPDYVVHTRCAGEDWARTSLKLPPSIKWTDKNFHELLMKRITGDISL